MELPLASPYPLVHDAPAAPHGGKIAAGLRVRLDTLSYRRGLALGRGDDATVAICEDHIIRCELLVERFEAWHAER